MSGENTALEPLLADEQRLLEYLTTSSSAPIARRAQIVLGWQAGEDESVIAERVGLTVRTVRRWIQAFKQDRMDIFPDPGLADGAIESGEAAPEEVERPSVADICRLYAVDMAHAHQVAELAARLFEGMVETHGLPGHYATTAYYAGLLHNIAYAGGRARHHTRGRDILLDTPLSDLGYDDRAVIAVTTAFHRKKWYEGRQKLEHSYRALPKNQRLAALKLSALVRIADGLDYSQSQSTRIVTIGRDCNGVVIVVDGPFALYDSARADLKADCWRSIFDVPVSVTLLGEVVLHEGGGYKRPSPGITPDDLMSEAGRKLFRFHFERLLQNEPGTRKGVDPEALHDMRVASRRMGAALRVFGGYYTKDARRALKRGISNTRRALGRVRDLDVFLENAQSYVSQLPDDQKNVLDSVFEVCNKRREKARKKMFAYLDGEDYSNFVDFMETLVTSPGAASQKKRNKPVNEAVSKTISKGCKKVYAYTEHLPGVSLASLHKLRIETKRLRYTLEFFREVLIEEADEAIAGLVQLQDLLGELHDADVAQDLLRKTMAGILKKTRKEQKRAIDPVDMPSLAGVVAYIEDRESVILRLQEDVLDLWQTVVLGDLKENLQRVLDSL